MSIFLVRIDCVTLFNYLIYKGKNLTMESQHILDSWKEIADYLRRAVRTCQRWEIDLGLPIHRLDGSPRASVFAYKEEIDAWLKRMLQEQQIQKISFLINILRRPNVLIPLVLSITALVFIVFVVWKIVWPVRMVPATVVKPSLAVFPFENNSGDHALEKWRMGLSELLIADLSQSRHLRVLSGERVLSILKRLDLTDSQKYTSEDLTDVAKQGRIDYTVNGSFLKTGDKIIILALLQDPRSGTVIRSKKMECQRDEDIPAKVDELTEEIKYGMNLSEEQIAGDMDEDVGRILTDSPEAIFYYLEGKNYYSQEKFEKSIASYMEAVRIDPDFALAYRMIAENYHYMGEFEKARKYIQKALLLAESDRVSYRDRFLIQAFAATILEKSYLKPVEIYKQLLESYPDDEDGNIGLGALYRNMEDWELAQERFDSIRHINPEIAFTNLFYINMSLGDYDKTWDILEVYGETFSSRSLFHRSRGLLYLCQGDLDQALDEAENALFHEPVYYLSPLLKGHVLRLKGDFLAAEEAYGQLVSGTKPALKRYWLGHLFLAQGQYEMARQEVNQGIEETRAGGSKMDLTDLLLLLSYIEMRREDLVTALGAADQARDLADRHKLKGFEEMALRQKGLVQLSIGKRQEAEKTAENLKRLTEETGSLKRIRYYHYLRGMLALSRNIYPLAVEEFEKALALVSHQKETFDEHALFMDALASAYEKAGEVDRALAEYERITRLTSGCLMYGDIYAKSHFNMGMILEQMEKENEAMEHYKKFLQVWRLADKDIPEVAKSKEGLQRIGE